MSDTVPDVVSEISPEEIAGESSGLGRYWIWFIVLIVAVVVIWLIWGRSEKDYDFVGLKPLNPKYKGKYNPWDDAGPTEQARWNETRTIDNTAETLSRRTTGPKDAVPSIKRVRSGTDNIDLTPRHPDGIIKVTRIPRTVEEGQKWRSKGEEACAKALKRIFDEEFITIHPDWLKNPETGRNLEIDCACLKLMVGCEYQGSQHYVYPNFFHRSYEDFVKQTQRDNYKAQQCDRVGFYLITVPYTVKLDDIEDYIRYYLPNGPWLKHNDNLVDPPGPSGPKQSAPHPVITVVDS